MMDTISMRKRAWLAYVLKTNNLLKVVGSRNNVRKKISG